MNRIRIGRLLMLLLLALCLTVPSTAENAAGNGEAAALSALALPVFTETACEWDEAGNLISETATDLSGAPALNDRGFHRAEYTWDGDNNLLSEAYFGLNGEPVVIDQGYARAEYTWGQNSRGESHILTEDRYAADGSRAQIPGSYSFRVDQWERDQILSSAWYDASGSLTRPTGGYARILYDVSADDAVTTVTKTYEDAAGNLLPGKEGAGKLVTAYVTDLDRAVEKNLVTRTALGNTRDNGSRAAVMLPLYTEIYTVSGEPTLGGHRWFRQANTYDDRGNLIRIDNYDAEGTPILSAEGYASLVNIYDDQDRLIQSDYLDISGDLIKMINGYARITWEYDGSSRIHYIRYFGADGNRTMMTNGYSMEEREYDGEDYDYRVTYYDTLDRYTMSNGGFARIEDLYYRAHRVDDEGNDLWVIQPDQIERERYFGTDLELIQLKAGHAGLENHRNENGQVIETVFMDAAWEPTRHDERQYASITFTYDSPAQDAPAVSEAYFDETGAPCEGLTGAYGRQMVYGGPKQNLLLSERFLDASGNPDTCVSHGAHRVDYAYDGNMTQTAARYYGIDGQPIITRYGYAAILREYNASGSLLWQATFDENGNLTAGGSTSVVQVHAYDPAGHHIGEKHYSADGAPVTQAAGYASVLYTYNAAGDIATIAWFNAGDEPVAVSGAAKVEREYDDQHHLTYEITRGVDGQPAVNAQGYAARAMEYDPVTGMTSRVTYYDGEGNMALLSAGYAAYEVKYDLSGTLLLRSYYDDQGNPVNPPSVGYARFERQVDSLGRVTEEASYDADGSLLVNRDGYAVTATGYSDNTVTVTYLDADRKPVDTALGYARVATEYDYTGERKLAERYYNAALEPAENLQGYAALLYTLEPDGRISGISYLDAAGNGTNGPEGYASALYEYDSRGNLTREAYYDRDGHMARATGGAAQIIREYDSEGRLLSERYYDESEAPYMLRGDYAAVTHTYDANGNETEEAYFGMDGAYAVSSKGYAVRRAAFDQASHLLTEEYLDADGKLLVQSSGYAKRTQTWNAEGFLASESYTGADGNYILIDGKYSLKTYAYDVSGRLTEEAWFIFEGQPTMLADGYNRVTHEYDEAGNRIRSVYYMTDKPVLTVPGYAAAEFTYDARGRLTQESYFDESMARTVIRKGYSAIAYVYDNAGNTLQVRYLDENDQLTRVPEGFSVWQREYDRNNHVILEQYLDERERIASLTWRASASRRVYDARGNLVRLENLNAAMQPVETQAGYATITYTYDAQDRKTGETYLNAGGSPVIISSGYAGIRYEYSDQGRVWRTTYLDTYGQPTIFKDGYAASQFLYDDNQYVTSITYLDEQYARTYISAGYSALVRSVDKNGDILTETYLDNQDLPVNSAAGYATQRNTWDARRRLIRREYLNADGQPVILSGGYSALGYAYDNSDNRIRQSYYSKAGELIWGPSGYAEIVYTYDERNHCVEERLLNTNGAPAIHTTGRYSRLTREVEADGRVLSVSYWDASGEPVLYQNDYAVIRYEYDLAGRETSRSFYDRAGNLSASSRAYARKTTAYNELGNVTEEAYYDTEGNLTDTTMGYAKAVYTYDDLGNLTSERYYNTKELGVVPEGSSYAYELMEYDDLSRLISEEYFNELDEYAPSLEGYAIHRIEYADSGRVSLETYLDENQKPIAVGGFSRRELIGEDEEARTYTMRVLNESPEEDQQVLNAIYTYDRYDRVIAISYEDGEGNPVAGPEGASLVTRAYTSRGQVTLEQYFDASGAAFAVDGYYGIRMTYNPYGKLERKIWLDANGDPAENSEGYAAILYDYDLTNSSRVEKEFRYYENAAGGKTAAINGAWGMSILYYPVTRVHEVTFLGENGEPVTTLDGYAILEYEEDENGNRVWEGYYDDIHAQVDCADGYSSVERNYDGEGRMISERYLDHYNKLTNNAEGVAGWNGYYDADGNLVITSRYDQDRIALPADAE